MDFRVFASAAVSIFAGLCRSLNKTRAFPGFFLITARNLDMRSNYSTH
jgi:hypothetical protein